MGLFFTWLYTKPKSYLLHIIGLTTALLIYMTTVVIAMTILGVSGPDWMELEDKPVEYRFIFLLFLFLGIPLNSILEELIYRMPLTLICRVWPGHHVSLWAAVTSSIIFGCVHGGIATLPMQGVLGIVLSLSYLKCGGMEGKFWRPYAVTVTIHTLYNFPLICTGLTGTFLELI